MSDNILELKHITKLYPGVVALNDVWKAYRDTISEADMNTVE